ncbi:hypothetical protein PF005_g10149 [Phytophthora fragariae]|uniref:Uncharacterized protein n=1 Tax=Phytophthora fragariae TaxID=53985 RepID=A0A6A3KU83_9STRA|nr:hypothetical protein PF009_g11288 [Phytophthora fragariae]KAE9010550.1 hypothetical protein PF011_g9773 [Phytophthora fragariae]KAE9114932.1 hypothetical protein PF007_g10193 [Phytophthora fragariae]KAE9145966.1 hypothetical protein PF006_g9215 [Phytophthora fragariae]KAE9213561.1 hypothetical protein PF005_g10149 [Phytophthora fragariae]
MPEYLEMTTPERDSEVQARLEEMDMTEREQDETIQVEDSPNKYESMPRFEGGITSRGSDNFSPDKSTEAGRSVARVYVPTLQERVHVVMLGPFGLVLELINFVLIMLIFSAYIAEYRSARFCGVTPDESTSATCVVLGAINPLSA